MSKAFADEFGVGMLVSMDGHELRRRVAKEDFDADFFGQDAGGPSMTRQEFSDECDVNRIMANYEKNGIWPVQAGMVEPRYLDLTVVPSDLVTAMNQMIDAEAAFMTLPALVRKEFDNDAVKFVEYASNGDNLEKLREWGLAPPQAAPEPPMKVEVVNPPAAEDK